MESVGPILSGDWSRESVGPATRADPRHRSEQHRGAVRTLSGRRDTHLSPRPGFRHIGEAFKLRRRFPASWHCRAGMDAGHGCSGSRSRQR